MDKTFLVTLYYCCYNLDMKLLMYFTYHSCKVIALQDLRFITLIHTHEFNQRASQVWTPTSQVDTNGISVHDSEVQISLLSHTHGSKIQNILTWTPGKKLRKN